MATNAQVAYRAAAVKGEHLAEADLTPRVTAIYNWLQTLTTTEEVQTVTEGGSGLTSFTLTFAGQTTGAIAAGATAGQVQTALEALSNVNPGDVVVTGSAGGPFTVTFGGQYADTNVAEMTSTPTGGTGTVTVATQVAGGAATTAKDIGDAQAAVLAAASAYASRDGVDNVSDLLAKAATLYSDISGHAQGQGS